MDKEIGKERQRMTIKYTFQSGDVGILGWSWLGVDCFPPIR